MHAWLHDRLPATAVIYASPAKRAQQTALALAHLGAREFFTVEEFDLTGQAGETAHGEYPVETRRCTLCHNPHSSTQAKLLKSSVHEPVAKHECDSCHKEPTAADAFKTAQKDGELCSQCHEADSLMAGGTVQHDPFQEGMCLSCHNPHASESPKLMAQQGNKVCFTCHGEKEEAVAVGHKPVTGEKGCLSCHAPHAAANKGLALGGERFKSEIEQLCGRRMGAGKMGRPAASRRCGSASRRWTAGGTPSSWPRAS